MSLDEFPVLLSESSDDVGCYESNDGCASSGDSNVVVVPRSHQLSAAAAIVRLCAENPGEISIVTIGPQTNVAIALKLEPNLPLLAKRVCMMGGAFNGRGNVSPVAEANVFHDPEATKLIFQSFPDIVIAPLDVTHQITMDESHLDKLEEAGYVGKFLSLVSRYYLKAYVSIGAPHLYVHDAAIIMYLMHPELFQHQRGFVDTETKGEVTHGQTVADFRSACTKPRQATILLKVDNESFLRIYQEHISSLSASQQETHDLHMSKLVNL